MLLYKFAHYCFLCEAHNEYAGVFVQISVLTKNKSLFRSSSVIADRKLGKRFILNVQNYGAFQSFLTSLNLKRKVCDKVFT